MTTASIYVVPASEKRASAGSRFVSAENTPQLLAGGVGLFFRGETKTE